MNKQGFFLDFINVVFSKFQLFFSKLDFLSDYIQKLIFFLILFVFILSTFMSSEILGIFALAIFILTIFNMLIQKGACFEMNLFEKFLFVWFLVVIVSLFGSTLFTLSLKGFLKTVTYMGFYVSVVQFFRKNLSLIYPTILVIASCAAIQGLVGISQNFNGVEEISTWQDTSSINPEAVMTRVYGTLKPLNPNLFGGYLTAALPCLFASVIFFFSNKRYIWASTYSILTFLTIISLILSGCRGAYVSLFFMFLCFSFYFGKLIFEKHNNFLKNFYITLLSTIFVFGFSMAMMITSIRTRILSIFVLRADSSTSFRFNVYQAVVQMLKDNWLVGIGIGNKNFREIYGLYMKTGFDALSTYNVFTELFVESGIFSILAYLLFLFFIIKYAFKYLIKPQQNRTIVAISIFSILSVMVHGLFDTIYFRPQVQFIFWTMVSFISAVLYSKNCNGCKE